MTKNFLILFLLSLPLLGFAQMKSEVWTDYNHTQFVTKDLSIFGDVSYRFAENDIIVFRPSIKYIVSPKVKIMGGLGNFYSFTPDLEPKAYEFRPWQGVQLIWPQTAYFSIKHLFRLEEQMVFSYIPESKYTYRTRFRYQIATEIDIWETPSGAISISLPIEYEMFDFINRPENFIERDRIISGIIFRFARYWRLEFNYVVQREGEGFENLTPETTIYRIRLRHSVFKVKPKLIEEEPQQL
ncbi:MAG: DUF2490 domain-containing protein [Flavobacteriales bacterium]|nr:DUF2490 domain-containing protein [Flavobacteriales bacterium]